MKKTKSIIIYNNKKFELDLNNQYDISIPVNFNDTQPNFYGSEIAKMKPFKSKKVTWSVLDGASCNVPEITMNIHCNGTHTECVGHLLSNYKSIGSILNDILVPSLLITVKSSKIENSKEKYHKDNIKDELFITSQTIKKEILNSRCDEFSGLIIRTQPNTKLKLNSCYPEKKYPFLSNDAVKFLNEIGLEHLFIDTPSIDRYDDDGILGNHRIFWSKNDNLNSELNFSSNKTITEFCYISNKIKDGFYFVNLQLPNFKLDAAPSRPILIKTKLLQ